VTVTVAVHNALEEPMEGAVVSGSWSGGANGSGSCTTDLLGTCSLSKNNLKANSASVTFTVTEILRGPDSYSPVANHDTDGDSDGTVITVSKP
jgi:hypothetical protein